MTLPTSRDATFTASSPVLSTVLNNVQDQIIGMKHPTRPLNFGAAAWQAKSGGGGALGAGQWSFSSTTELVCDLSGSIPEGDRLITVTWSYNRGGAGNVRLRLKERDLTTPGAAEASVVAETVVASGTGLTTNPITYNYTFKAGFAVWLEVQCDNAANVFLGAHLTHDRL